jgi:23S rRNA pseudouridine2605 synthase
MSERLRKPGAAKKTAARRVGLARALSKLGHCSRTQAVELIKAGRVGLNGKTQTDPATPVNLKIDRIEVDHHRVESGEKIYVLLNKPRGVVTTASDEKNRPTIYTCLAETLPWVAPVGRLDMASEGLLLLTNDSEWGARIAAPETHLDKTYHVRVRAKPDEALLNSLLTGVQTSEGDLLKAKSASLIRHGDRNTWVEIVLDEGKNRHIRRMFETLGIEVLRLVRVAIGPVPLGELPKGSCRRLTLREKTILDHAMRGAPRQIVAALRHKETRDRNFRNK